MPKKEGWLAFKSKCAHIKHTMSSEQKVQGAWPLKSLVILDGLQYQVAYECLGYMKP